MALETQGRQITVLVDELEEALRILRREGVDYEIDPGGRRMVEPATGTVVLLVLGSAFAVAAAQRAIEQWRGGLVLDLRVNAPQLTRRSRDLPYGTLLLVASDGTVSMKTERPEDMFDQLLAPVLAAVQGLHGASAVQVEQSLAGLGLRADPAVIASGEDASAAESDSI